MPCRHLPAPPVWLCTPGMVHAQLHESRLLQSKTPLVVLSALLMVQGYTLGARRILQDDASKRRFWDGSLIILCKIISNCHYCCAASSPGLAPQENL